MHKYNGSGQLKVHFSIEGETQAPPCDLSKFIREKYLLIHQNSEGNDSFFFSLSLLLLFLLLSSSFLSSRRERREHQSCYYYYSTSSKEVTHICLSTRNKFREINDF